MTKEDFLKKVKLVHGEKYDYSNVDYVNNKTKISILCPTHGEFWQRPCGHLNGKGCRKCGFIDTGNKNKDNINIFIEKANKVHDETYNYNKSIYINSTTPVEIMCNKHGSFWQKPVNHLKGCKCPKCSLENRKKIRSLTTEEFITKSNLIHRNKYTYELCVYENGKTMVDINCRQHGFFNQRAESHLNGHGCPKCNPSNKLTSVNFINRGNEIHYNKYDYSKMNYQNSKIKVIIICPEHGEFNQIPSDHLNGHGCPICSESRIEKIVNELLLKNNVSFNRQKQFNWLGTQSLDFYIYDKNIGIECQGIQHFKAIDYFGGILEFNKIKERDKRKKRLCNENNITLKYINYFDNITEQIENILGTMN